MNQTRAGLLLITTLFVTAIVLAGCSSNNTQTLLSSNSGAPAQTTGRMMGSGGMMSGITQAQLAAHNSESDCWVGYQGRVYDITSFLPEHPGGVAVIAQYCGTSSDFEQAFTEKHGTSKVRRLKASATDEGPLV